MNIFELVFLPAVLAFLVSFLTTPLVIWAAPYLGIIDDPKVRKHPATLHTKPIPRGGGLPIFLGILAATLFFLPLDKKLLGILAGAAQVVILGLWDDKKDVSPYLRLIGQFLAAGSVVAAGIDIAFVSNPQGGVIDLSQPRLVFQLFGEQKEIWILSSALALIWIVGIMNAVSWSSGVDGQLSGFATIAAFTLALISLKFSADITPWPVSILAASTAGAYLGFLPFHAYPQKIMPGFGGGVLAGFMLAVISILATAKVGTLLIVLAIPVIDAAFAVIRRILAGKSPVWGDRGHLHHRLLAAGWTKLQVAIAYWVATGILAILALWLNAVGKFYTIIGIALVIGAIFLWLPSFGQLQKQQDLVSGLKTSRSLRR
jgi:UDP-GlcNAc:undecaprenyl-phosphate GlcNAc-1-phosphate transferase